MFKKHQDDALWQLQQELLAAEAEPEDDPREEEDWSDEDLEDCFDSDDEEEYEQEQFRCLSAAGYGRGSQKRFAEDDIFDDADFDDEDVLYRKDFRKAKRKLRRRRFGLLLLAVLELAAIAALILWWLSWAA